MPLPGPTYSLALGLSSLAYFHTRLNTSMVKCPLDQPLSYTVALKNVEGVELAAPLFLWADMHPMRDGVCSLSCC